MTTSNAIQRLAEWLALAKHAVAFTGAGINTESGIPDFRSPGGLWSKVQPVYFQKFLAIGSSLVVEPAASLPRIARKARARPRDHQPRADRARRGRPSW
ncbi:MAG: hypothetical protein KF708_10275 [Pirellulales bacterium]|nr:hypothetical protein [Pirellulales bacterium]